MTEDNKKGKEHPISIVINDAVRIFSDLGFEVAVGPEIEDEWHNFDALNVPKDHPARDMQDTFWLKTRINADGTQINADKELFYKDLSYKIHEDLHRNPRVSALLRTHTSPVQIRYMENFVKSGQKPPFAIVVPGKVFRNEATDAGHEMQFYQLEGLMIGEDISVANMKYILLEFFKRFLGENTEIRLRPSFFPFVEPGFEVDVFRPEPLPAPMLRQAGRIHPSSPKVSAGQRPNL